GKGPVTAAIVDAYGTASEPKRSEASVAFEAPLLRPPDGLAVEVTDRAARNVRLRWSPVQGAKEYLVFRSSAGSESKTLDPVAAPEALDSVPPGAQSVLYFVQARVAPGVASAKSVPITVSF